MIILQNRREAKKYAENLVKASFVKHTLHRTTFSEQCYFAFTDDVSSIGKIYFLLIHLVNCFKVYTILGDSDMQG